MIEIAVLILKRVYKIGNIRAHPFGQKTGIFESVTDPREAYKSKRLTGGFRIGKKLVFLPFVNGGLVIPRGI